MSDNLRMRLKLVLVALIPLLTFSGLAGSALSHALQRPVEYDYFDEALAKTTIPAIAVNWTQGPPTDRPFGAVEAFEAGRAITEAWNLHAAALVTLDTTYLSDRFSGTALTRATASAARPDTRMVVLHHDAMPIFFHRDGSVLQVADNALTARFTLEDKALQDFRITQDKTVTILQNEASGWHIISHERQAADALPEVDAPYKAAPKLAGINYYPAATPWSKFWPSFDLDVVRRDLALIQKLGANSIRIFLPRTDFLNPDQAPANLKNLQLLLAAAQDHGLQVVPTLFDLRGGYAPGMWADDYAALQLVLPILAAAPNVAFVDLKNEADLDYEWHGKGTVQAWLRAMVASCRTIAPDLPLTVGWSTAAAAAEMADLVDVVTYHDYHPIEQSVDGLAMVRAAAKTKPVFVTEVGGSSWAAWLGYPSSPSKQADIITTRGAALQKADGLFIWTLHDFPEPDKSVIGPSPWVLALQSQFGLYDANGQEKPAAAAARTLFSTILKGITP